MGYIEHNCADFSHLNFPIGLVRRRGLLSAAAGHDFRARQKIRLTRQSACN